MKNRLKEEEKIFRGYYLVVHDMRIKIKVEVVGT